MEDLKMSELGNVTKVIINGRSYDIDGNATSLAEVKSAAVEIDPGLSNADPVVEGDTIVFTRRAGTKGADDVKYVTVGARRYEITPGMYSNPNQIKDALLEVHPEISNYDYVISEGTMSFIKRAGTKGC